MRVLVRPCYSDFLQNRLFERRHSQASHWMEPFVLLREKAASQGIEMATWDMLPLETADVVYFQDLPAHRRELDDARRRAPNARFVLQLLESPLSRPTMFVPENHTAFDAILTYNWRLCDERRYFHYFLPLGKPHVQPAEMAFEERRPMALLNSNRCIGVFANRQPGWSGVPFFGPAFSGFRVPLPALIRQNAGELYGVRRRIARLADRMEGSILDVWGAGWRGEPMGWIHRLFRNRPFGNARGAFRGDKTELLARYRFVLAYENMVADVGYISEKLFDALYAGSVPVYLGDRRITEHVPAECFVDARKFASSRALLEFARDCPKDQWSRMRAAGQAFLASPEMAKFGSEAFAERALAVLRKVMADAVAERPAR